ncbi:MAG TPA: hypothetical protein VGV85_03575, partial [Longimicrobiaceae bacterium]|nr:hypothetical protein [Longimicrobiaceae bacterium]
MRRATSFVLITVGGGVGLLGFLAQGLVAKSGSGSGIGEVLRGAYSSTGLKALSAGTGGGGGFGGAPGGAAFRAVDAGTQFASFIEEEYQPAAVTSDTIRYRVCKDLSVCYIASRAPRGGIPIPGTPPLLMTGPQVFPDVPVATPGTRLGYLASIPLLGLAGYTMIGDDDGGVSGANPPGGQPQPG